MPGNDEIIQTAPREGEFAIRKSLVLLLHCTLVIKKLMTVTRSKMLQKVEIEMNC